MSSDNFKDRLSQMVGEGRKVRAFAKRCGFSETVLRKYLTGQTLPGLDNLLKIADTANVPIEWLAKGEGSAPCNAPVDLEVCKLIGIYNDLDAKGKADMMKSAEKEALIKKAKEIIEVKDLEV